MRFPNQGNGDDKSLHSLPTQTSHSFPGDDNGAAIIASHQFLFLLEVAGGFLLEGVITSFLFYLSWSLLSSNKHLSVRDSDSLQQPEQIATYFKMNMVFEKIHPLAPDILQARLSQKIITPEEYSPLKKYSLLAQDILQATIVLLSAACK